MEQVIQNEVEGKKLTKVHKFPTLLLDQKYMECKGKYSLPLSGLNHTARARGSEGTHTLCHRSISFPQGALNTTTSNAKASLAQGAPTAVQETNAYNNVK
jgi:hypothetical protein